jgi:hypothetical protein
MTNLELELAALRQRRPSSRIVAWIRRHRPFDRRSIRVPADRDAYWAAVQRRLAESDAVSLSRRASGPPAPVLLGPDRSALIGAE